LCLLPWWRNLHYSFTCDMIVWTCTNELVTGHMVIWFYFHLQKHQVMAEVMGSQNMVSMCTFRFLSQGKSIFESGDKQYFIEDDKASHGLNKVDTYCLHVIKMSQRMKLVQTWCLYVVYTYMVVIHMHWGII